MCGFSGISPTNSGYSIFRSFSRACTPFRSACTVSIGVSKGYRYYEFWLAIREKNVREQRMFYSSKQARRRKDEGTITIDPSKIIAYF